MAPRKLRNRRKARGEGRQHTLLAANDTPGPFPPAAWFCAVPVGNSSRLCSQKADAESLANLLQVTETRVGTGPKVRPGAHKCWSGRRGREKTGPCNPCQEGGRSEVLCPPRSPALCWLCNSPAIGRCGASHVPGGAGGGCDGVRL